MQTSDFSFELPNHLIAQHPAEQRNLSRLFVLNPQKKEWHHGKVTDLPIWLDENTVMVFNNSRVRKARVFAQLETGSKVEVLFQHQISPDHWLCMTTKSKRLLVGTPILFPDGLRARVSECRVGGLKVISPEFKLTETFFEKYGQIPLPPYIKRPDNPQDDERYQTVYSKNTGSVAAPTAGLHFDEALLKALEERCIQREFITLHVGLGTFLPVRSSTIEDHTMHEESYNLSAETANRLNEAKAQGKRILAVGTTSLRTLESNFQQDRFWAGDFSTQIFIYPGYQFNCVDALFTNFHTPESTLIMLVSAFGGLEFVKKAYFEAIQQEYRFFSYGDACLFLNHLI